MNMPMSEAKRKWEAKNALVFSVKLMRKSEPDLVEYFDKMLERGIGRCTLVKLAVREYMANHREVE